MWWGKVKTRIPTLGVGTNKNVHQFFCGASERKCITFFGIGTPLFRTYRISGKSVHHFFKKRASLFQKTCITFSPETRITNFTNRPPRFRKTVNPKSYITLAGCSERLGHQPHCLVQLRGVSSEENHLHTACLVQTACSQVWLPWGKKGHTPAAFEVDQACTEAKTSKSFTTEKGPFPCQGPSKFIF